MRIFGESCCFCNGAGKSERMKVGIFSGKASAMARISDTGTGFLIHRNLLLTTHANLPSVTAAEAAKIRLQNGLSASLFPHRFYITSPVLDITMVGLDVLDGESNVPLQQPHYLKTCSKPNLELGSIVYLLGYTEKHELTVGEGKVVIATDNLIKLSTDGITWSPGSAGFDIHGNLAFMVCEPMKLATSPNTKSSSIVSSTSSSKKDTPMQFGIPIPIICGWLNQHWEGNHDDLNKPKLPLIRLVSSGPKSEHSCASFTMRQVFKSTEAGNDGTPMSSNLMTRPIEQPAPSPAAASTSENETLTDYPNSVTHPQGIPTPEIYESSILNSVPVRKKKEVTQIQLLDINFPPRIAKAALSPQPSRKILPKCDQNYVKDFLLQKFPGGKRDIGPSGPMADAESTGSVNGGHSEAHSNSSPVEMQEVPHEYSSEGETTMYSAESRNYSSPKENNNFYHAGRSQSCVNYNRWGPVQRTPVARGAMLEKHRSFTQGRKVYSQSATSQRSNNEYFSPTVSSIMRKRNNLELKSRPRQSVVHSSPKWNF